MDITGGAKSAQEKRRRYGRINALVRLSTDPQIEEKATRLREKLKNATPKQMQDALFKAAFDKEVQEVFGLNPGTLTAEARGQREAQAEEPEPELDHDIRPLGLVQTDLGIHAPETPLTRAVDFAGRARLRSMRNTLSRSRSRGSEVPQIPAQDPNQFDLTTNTPREKGLGDIAQNIASAAGAAAARGARAVGGVAADAALATGAAGFGLVANAANAAAVSAADYATTGMIAATSNIAKGAAYGAASLQEAVAAGAISTQQFLQARRDLARMTDHRTVPAGTPGMVASRRLAIEDREQAAGEAQERSTHGSTDGVPEVTQALGVTTGLPQASPAAVSPPDNPDLDDFGFPKPNERAALDYSTPEEEEGGQTDYDTDEGAVPGEVPPPPTAPPERYRATPDSSTPPRTGTRPASDSINAAFAARQAAQAAQAPQPAEQRSGPDNDPTAQAGAVNNAANLQPLQPGGSRTQWGVAAYTGTGQQYANITRADPTEAPAGVLRQEQIEMRRRAQSEFIDTSLAPVEAISAAFQPPVPGVAPYYYGTYTSAFMG